MPTVVIPGCKEGAKGTGEREEPEYGARRCLRFNFNVNMRFNDPSKAGCAGADHTHTHTHTNNLFPRFLSLHINVQMNLPQCTQETRLNNYIFSTFALFTSETCRIPSTNFCSELELHLKRTGPDYTM